MKILLYFIGYFIIGLIITALAAKFSPKSKDQRPITDEEMGIIYGLFWPCTIPMCLLWIIIIVPYKIIYQKVSKHGKDI